MNVPVPMAMTTHSTSKRSILGDRDNSLGDVAQPLVKNVITGVEWTHDFMRYMESSERGRLMEQRWEHLEEINPKAYVAAIRRNDNHSIEAIAKHQGCSVRTVQRSLARAAEILESASPLPSPEGLEYGEREKLLRQRDPRAYEVYLWLSHEWPIKKIAERMGISTASAYRLANKARKWLGGPRHHIRRSVNHQRTVAATPEVSTEDIRDRLQERGILPV